MGFIRLPVASGAASAVAALLVCATAAVAQTPAREHDVKAVFLFNFAKYVEWPAPPLGSSATLRVCVPANPEFLSVVRAAVRDEVINGRPLAAVPLEGLDGAKACDILYVGTTGTPDATAWLSAVRDQDVLTVGDGPLTDGVVIAFVRDQNRLRFDIDRATAGRRGLTISSKLLRLARQVRDR